MKSAYELALERLEKEAGPARKLTDEQKARIADIERVCDAKLAEVKLSYDGRLAAAANIEEYDKLQAELAEKCAALEAERRTEKDEVWNEA